MDTIPFLEIIVSFYSCRRPNVGCQKKGGINMLHQTVRGQDLDALLQTPHDESHSIYEESDSAHEADSAHEIDSSRNG
jgi:hypothetical protein